MSEVLHINMAGYKGVMNKGNVSRARQDLVSAVTDARVRPKVKRALAKAGMTVSDITGQKRGERPDIDPMLLDTPTPAGKKPRTFAALRDPPAGNGAAGAGAGAGAGSE